MEMSTKFKNLLEIILILMGELRKSKEAEDDQNMFFESSNVKLLMSFMHVSCFSTVHSKDLSKH